MDLKVIGETKEYVVINKPAGVLAHPTSRNEPDTLIAAVVERWPEIARVGDSPLRPGLVHRLDQGTSGVLVIAKTQPMFETLKSLFQNRQMKKTYRALVHGEVHDDEGFVDVAIGRSTKNTVKRVTALSRAVKDLKPALTRFRVVRRFTGYTLLEVFPETGRTHQIRVHLAHLGHPIAGDPLYRQKRTTPPTGLTRLFLHALRLEIPLPDGPKTFESPLPPELAAVLTRLPRTNSRSLRSFGL